MAALALSGALRAVRKAVCGPRHPLRAGVASAAAAAGRRGTAALLSPVRVGLLAGPASALRGAVAFSSAAGDDVVEVELKVEGMVCDGCSSRVEEELAKLPGVKKVHVDLEKGIATVAVEAASQIDAFNAMPQMVECVTGLGFTAEPHFGGAEA